MIWDGHIDGGAGDEFVSTLTLDKYGFPYMVGYTESFGAGYRDIFLVKANQTRRIEGAFAEVLQTELTSLPITLSKPVNPVSTSYFSVFEASTDVFSLIDRSSVQVNVTEFLFYQNSDEVNQWQGPKGVEFQYTLLF